MTVLAISLGIICVLTILAAAIAVGIFTNAVANLIFKSAQALDLEERINARIDERIGKVADRARELMARSKQESGDTPKTILDDETEAARERVRQGLNMRSMPAMEDEAETILGEMPIEA